jgi:S-adenosylmethionine:tRNA ribosyltransferase-isomerase
MRVDLFDFDLPPERIALRPAVPRDSARLLVLPAGDAPFEDRSVCDLPRLLRPGDALVVNDTRVIHARLDGYRLRGENKARVEATLIERLSPNRWRVLARPAKKLGLGERLRFGAPSASNACLLGALEATVEDKGESGEAILAFDLSGPVLDQAIEALGAMPLPPYIAGKRPADDRDEGDYQTIFASEAGAVAAPTAGLHFTPQLLYALAAAEVALHRVTLHVGAGTFLPVKAERTEDHAMHYEECVLNSQTAAELNAVRENGGRIIAVGTTALRCLESAAQDDENLQEYRARTNIFITPGYRWRVVDALLTNFHLPRSTLFMLVCAFSGVERMRAAYTHAIESGYRFYSYGDASLLYRS